MRTLLIVIGTLALMAACGAAAFAGMLMFLVHLGLKRHGSYEYYGGNLGAFLVFGAAALAFLAPGVVVLHLRRPKLHWQFSLRSLLIAMTIVAVLFGIVAVLLSS
jgi:hypothetical protein